MTNDEIHAKAADSKVLWQEAQKRAVDYSDYLFSLDDAEITDFMRIRLAQVEQLEWDRYEEMRVYRALA